MLSFASVNFNNWYRLMFNNFFKQLDFDMHYVSDIVVDPPYYHVSNKNTSLANPKHSVWFFDQEPLHTEAIRHVDSADKWYFSPGTKLFVTSEISNTVDRYTQGMNATSIYYFFHAIAANEWYHQYRWDRPHYYGHKHLFISYNNLVNPFRAHRIDLLCRLYDKNLISQGLVSYRVPDVTGEVERAVTRNPWYTNESKEIYERQKHQLDKPLIIDTENVEGYLSATIDLANCRDSFVHVVTETEFFKDKLHLTEKIFKPIVAGQPFLLLAGTGNLEYLRSYGFKTFSDYWDESYDNIADPGKRVEAVVAILEKLAGMSYAEQVAMRKDMQHIIEYNFDHLFTALRPIVVDEFIANTKAALDANDIAYSAGSVDYLRKLIVN
jgi:hypothetical protein